MNYLAHLFLAGDDEEFLAGNFLGDFVKGKPKDFNEKILCGIELHRKIDSFTDSHEVVKSCKKYVSSARAKYAGVLSDIFFDHFLAKNWNLYSRQTLSDFASFSYSALQKHQLSFPVEIRFILAKMIDGNWLMTYQDVRGIEFVLQRLSQRLKRENAVSGGIGDLLENYEKFDLAFQKFFPDVIKFAEDFRRRIEEK